MLVSDRAGRVKTYSLDALTDRGVFFVRPGGRMVIIDFATHQEGFLQSEHQHRWLGFDNADISRWLLAAGLVTGPSVRIAGDPLTVMVWQADRPERQAAKSTEAAAEAE